MSVLTVAAAPAGRRALGGLAALFMLGATLLGVPALIEATGRSDLYYTLTSVALLAIAAGGVWLTFYIGRINIGQAAYALAGGYVSAGLVPRRGVHLLVAPPGAGLFCGPPPLPLGLPLLRFRA